jgi:hypothetical protein
MLLLYYEHVITKEKAMSVISSYFKEEGGFKARADVVRENEEYKIVIYDQNGEYVTERSFPGKSVHYAESAAENWAMGIEFLVD